MSRRRAGRSWRKGRPRRRGYTGRDAETDGGRAERTERRDKKAEERAAELRAAIRAILTEKKLPMTRKELWESLPEALRVNEVKFKEMLVEGAGTEWEREGNQGDGFHYMLAGG